TIIARWPGVTVSVIGFSGPLAICGMVSRAIFMCTGLSTVTHATRNETTVNNVANMPAAISRRPRLRSIAARRRFSAAVTWKCSMRSTASRGGAPRRIRRRLNRDPAPGDAASGDEVPDDEVPAGEVLADEALA